VFCCVAGAVHGVTLTWLATVEGAVDEEEHGSGGGGGGSGDGEGGGGGGGGELTLPSVVTLLDSAEVLLGVAPIGDPLAEGLLIAVDAAGVTHGLHPSPPLPQALDGDDLDGDKAGIVRNVVTKAHKTDAR